MTGRGFCDLLPVANSWSSAWNMLWQEGAGYAQGELQRTAVHETCNNTHTVYVQVQPHAERFAEACKLDRAYIDNFGACVKL
eukprot:1142658-Pelagomonas_calceolata.AAC.1